MPRSALPPDVGRGFAAPESALLNRGAMPQFWATPYEFQRAKPVPGHSPKFLSDSMARQSRAPHIRRQRRTVYSSEF